MRKTWRRFQKTGFSLPSQWLRRITTPSGLHAKLDHHFFRALGDELAHFYHHSFFFAPTLRYLACVQSVSGLKSLNVAKAATNSC
jgi:hypothetical protein